MDLEKCLQVVIEATQLAAKVVKEGFYSQKNIKHKDEGTANFVTETDLNSEKIIIAHLQKHYPNVIIVSEEMNNKKITNDYTFVIDPIDGTTNFVHMYPFVGISIALCLNRQPILGVIYNPIIDEMFHAIKGKGAFLNGKPIKVNPYTELKDCLISTNFPYDRREERLNELFKQMFNLLVNKVHGIRCSGSAVMNFCGVACGRLDVYFEKDIQSWDMAAGKIIVEEAGGVVLDLFGGEFDIDAKRCIVANNREIANQIIKCINLFNH